MEINDFIQKFADQFDDAEIGILNSNTVFKDIENWSSLIALSIIAMVDEEYDVRLKGDDIKTAITIEDLFNIVKGRL
jgi:acyl carrier protein